MDAYTSRLHKEEGIRPKASKRKEIKKDKGINQTQTGKRRATTINKENYRFFQKI